MSVSVSVCACVCVCVSGKEERSATHDFFFRSLMDSIQTAATECPGFQRVIPKNRDDETRISAIERELIKLGSEVRRGGEGDGGGRGWGRGWGVRWGKGRGGGEGGE